MNIRNFLEFNENIRNIDYLDTYRKYTSYLIGNNFKTTDVDNWRKGKGVEFTNEEYIQIESIVNYSIIDSNLYPPTYNHHRNNPETISLMFNLKELKTNINIVDLTIQKTEDYFCAHLQEYTGDRDYPRYDKTKTFLYQFSFDELKSFLKLLIDEINILSKK